MKPVYYLQTDKRWSGKSYSAPGESTTIGRAGCGPTSAAMVIASLTDSSVTPLTTAKWSLSHGYKALRQGTYYSYFVPQLKAYGIGCIQLNQYNNWHNNDQAKLRASVRSHLQQGHWLIVCMGKGTWTSSGHFIVAYGVDGSGRVLINDPASTANHRTHGDMNTFLNEAKFFWLIEWTGNDSGKDKDQTATGTDKGGTDMTEERVRQLIEESESRIVNKAVEAVSKILVGEDSEPSEWAKDEHIISNGIAYGITDGSKPQGYAKREEVIAMVLRALKVGETE